MAKKISQLPPAAAPLTGAEQLPAVQATASVKTTAAQIVNLARATLQGSEVEVRAAPSSGASSGPIDLSGIGSGLSVVITGGAPTYTEACACAATANLTRSGEQTIDGVATSGSRVLLTGQTAAKDNGVWVTASGAWTRAADANVGQGHCDDPVSHGQNVKVAGGSANKGSWTLATANPVTLGTTSLTYAKDGSTTAHNLAFTNPAQTFAITGFTGMTAGALPFTVRFDGAFELQHGDDFFLSNNGQDYLTMAGDMAMVFPVGADSCRVKLYPFSGVVTVLDARNSDGAGQRDIQFGDYAAGEPPVLRVAQGYSRGKVAAAGLVIQDGLGDTSDIMRVSVRPDGSPWPGPCVLNFTYSKPNLALDLGAGSNKSPNSTSYNQGRHAQDYEFQLETPSATARGGGKAIGCTDRNAAAGKSVTFDGMYVMPTNPTNSNVGAGRGIVALGRAAAEESGKTIGGSSGYTAATTAQYWNFSDVWNFGQDIAKGAITVAMSDEANKFAGIAMRTMASPSEGLDFRWNAALDELRMGVVTGDAYTACWGWPRTTCHMLPAQNNVFDIGSSSRRVRTLYANALDVRSTDDAAGESPQLLLDRQSATPAANDSLGDVLFRGRNSTGATTDYAMIVAEVVDPTVGSEDGKFRFRTKINGADISTAMQIGAGIFGAGLTDPGLGGAAFTNLTVTGNTTLGDAASDTVVINAKSITKPNAPAFQAKMNAANPQANVTGDGSSYIVIFDNERFDQSGDYNPANGVFTASIAGIYIFTASVELSGVVAGHTDFFLALIQAGNNRGCNFGDLTPDSSGRAALSHTALLSLNAGDQVFVMLRVSGAGKVVSIGSPADGTMFTGCRLA